MKSLFLLLFYVALIIASPVKTKFSPDRIENYERYLASLSQKSDESVETKLKRSLLYKIINITKYAKEQPPKFLKDSQIATPKAYVDAFLMYIEQKRLLNRLQNSFREVDEKVSYLKKVLESQNSETSFPSIEELQYTFYHISKNKLQKRIDLLKKALSNNMDVLKRALSNIKFKTENNLSQKKRLIKRLHDAKMELENLKIEMERLHLLGRTEKIGKLEKTIDYQKQKVDSITEKLIKIELEDFFSALQSGESAVFTIDKNIKNMVESLSDNKKARYADFLVTLEKMSAQRLGKTKILLHRTKEGLQMIEKDLWQKLKTPLFKINEKPISSWDMIVALFILIVGFTIAKLYRRYIRRITHTFINITPSNQIIVSNLGYYLILTGAFFIMLNSIGLDLSSLTLIAGALSVGIGFGLQNIVANFISGLILLFEKSIKIGDFLEIKDNLRGRVVDIHMRSITIRTNDNIDILVPNQTFIQNNVINWTLNDNRRRMRIPFGVAYGSDIKKVKTVILDALQKSSIHYIRDDETKQPLVVMTEMGSSSVNFELLVWVDGDETLKPLRTSDKFLVLIYNTLYENEIEIPFPQLDLHIREIESPQKKRIGE